MPNSEINLLRESHKDATTEFQGIRYTFVLLLKSWENAMAYSRLLGGHLVTVPDIATNAYLAERLLNESNAPSAWIGLNDIKVEGVYVWDSGAPLIYTNWSRWSPNNNSNSPRDRRGEDHVCIQRNYQWNDMNGYESAEHFMPFFVELTS